MRFPSRSSPSLATSRIHRARGSPGCSEPDGDYRRVLGAGPADVKEVEAQLLRLNAIVRKTPGITNPMGFSIETAGGLAPEADWFESSAGAPALTVRPLPASLGFGAFPVIGIR